MSREYNQIKVGMLLQKHRGELNLTQDYIAKKLGVSKTAVSNWENGVSRVDVKYLVPLSNIFGITVDDIIFSDINTYKSEFSYNVELVKKMFKGELADEGLCNKLIEMYIESKKDLIKKYKNNETISNSNDINWDFRFSNMKLEEMKEYEWANKHFENLIETEWAARYSYKVKQKNENNSIFHEIFDWNDGKLYYKSVFNYETDSSSYKCQKILVFSLIFERCEASLFQKYVKTFLPDYRNLLLKNTYESRKNKLDTKTKRLLTLLLRAKCKYIKDGEDCTIEIYERINGV